MKCKSGCVIENPYDPDTKVFEAYVQNRTPGAYCIFWCYGPKKGEITIIAITPVTDAALTLEQRLARFDPARHSGEVMASKAIGAERW